MFDFEKASKAHYLAQEHEILELEADGRRFAQALLAVFPAHTVRIFARRAFDEDAWTAAKARKYARDDDGWCMTLCVLAGALEVIEAHERGEK